MPLVRGWSGFLCLCFFAPGAQAHGALPGMAGFGSGLIHPLVTPAHLLLLLSLALWLAQRRPLQLRAALSTFVPASATGLALSTQIAYAAAWQPLLLCMALGVAALVLTGRRGPAWLPYPAFALAGLVVGLDSGVDAGAPALAVGVTLLATWLGLSLWLVNGAYYASLLPQRKWAQIGLRVAASWIAAICLLVLAFAIKRAGAG